MSAVDSSTSIPPVSLAGCVVLQPPAAGFTSRGLPQVVRAWIDERECEEIVVDDALRAMAALCLMERGQASRAAWGLQRVEQLHLLLALDHAESDARIADLCAALDRYLPATSIWQLESGTLRLIRGDDQRVPALVTQPEKVIEAIKSAPRPSLEIAREEVSVTSPATAPRTEVCSITREEIAMLLREDGADEEARP